MTVRWRFLGAARCESDALDIRFVPNATRLLAALVADGPVAVPAPRMAERVVDQSSTAPRSALRVAVSRLRAAVGSDAIETSAGGYRLVADDDQVDLWRFESLVERAANTKLPLGQRLVDAEAARALWTGPPFDGLTDAPWIDALVARLTERERDLTETWADVKIALGHHESVIAHLRDAVAAEPFRERRWALLMEALTRAGRRAEALLAFEQLHSSLAAEFGSLPSPSIQDLAQRIDRGDPTLVGVRAEMLRTIRPPAPTALVGIDEQIEHVTDLLERRRVVTIVGLGGAGKSQLALATASRHQGPVAFVDVGVLTSGDELASAVGASFDMLTAPLPAIALQQVVDRLRTVRALLVLDCCEPHLAHTSSVIATLVASCPHLTVLATSRVPLDLEWSVDVRVGPLELGTPTEPGPGAVLYADHAGIPRRYIEARWAEVQRAHQRSGGLAYLLVLLGRNAQLEAPLPLDTTGEVRLTGGVTAGIIDHLPGASRATLTALAVLPDGFGVDQGPWVIDRDGDDTELDLRLARTSGLLVRSLHSTGEDPTGSWFRFLDPVRDELLTRLDDDARRRVRERYARRLAHELEGVRTSPIEPWVYEVAVDLDRHSANAVAVLQHDLPLELTIDLATGIGAAWTAIGRAAAATQLLARLRPMADQTEGLRRAKFLLQYVTSIPSFALRAMHLADVEEMQRLAAEAGDRDLEHRAIAERAIGLGWCGRVPEARALLEQLEAEAERARHPWTLVQHRTLVALADALTGDIVGGAHRVAQLAHEFDAVGAPDSALSNRFMAGTLLRRAGELAAAERVLRLMPMQNSADIDGYSTAGAAYELALIARLTGRDDALPLLVRACELLDRFGEHRNAGVARRDLAAALVDQGDLDAATRELQRCIPILLRADRQGAAGAVALLAQIARRRGRGEAITLAGAAHHLRANGAGLALSPDEQHAFDDLPGEPLDLADDDLIALVVAV